MIHFAWNATRYLCIFTCNRSPRLSKPSATLDERAPSHANAQAADPIYRTHPENKTIWKLITIGLPSHPFSASALAGSAHLRPVSSLPTTSRPQTIHRRHNHMRHFPSAAEIGCAGTRLGGVDVTIPTSRARGTGRDVSTPPPKSACKKHAQQMPSRMSLIIPHLSSHSGRSFDACPPASAPGPRKLHHILHRRTRKCARGCMPPCRRDRY